MSKPQLPVVIIGAGPVGLAAAAHAVLRRMVPLVLEAGRSAWRRVPFRRQEKVDQLFLRNMAAYARLLG